MTCRQPDPRITWIVDYIQRHMADPLSVDGLAGQIHLSRSRFTALFTRQTGAPPMQYLQRMRLRRARLLAERTFLSVKEIMALVGYNDPSHFARDFRREHGVAPSEVQTRTPSVDPLTKRPIGPPRARDPGTVYA